MTSRAAEFVRRANVYPSWLSSFALAIFPPSLFWGREQQSCLHSWAGQFRLRLEIAASHVSTTAPWQWGLSSDGAPQRVYSSPNLSSSAEAPPPHEQRKIKWEMRKSKVLPLFSFLGLWSFAETLKKKKKRTWKSIAFNSENIHLLTQGLCPWTSKLCPA